MKIHVPDPHANLSVGSKRRPARGRVPTKISPNYRRPLETGVKGGSEREPIFCGEENGEYPRLVRANGMMVHGIRKGDERWVTGADVQPAIDAGHFIEVVDAEIEDDE